MDEQGQAVNEGQMVDMYIMGKHYRVPEDLTIMTAMEYCGYHLIRGCGCRAGSCGACVTVYRLKDRPQLQYGLACQTGVQPDMSVFQIPFFPTHQPAYDISEMEATVEQVLEVFPELATCFGCNTCTKSCPQELEVMESVSAALRGDFETVVDKSFHCVTCGMCAARCPQSLSPYEITMLCRRLHGRHNIPKSQHLTDRIKEIEEGKFDAEYQELVTMPAEKVRQVYDERWIEP